MCSGLILPRGGPALFSIHPPFWSLLEARLNGFRGGRLQSVSLASVVIIRRWPCQRVLTARKCRETPILGHFRNVQTATKAQSLFVIFAQQSVENRANPL
jgi:hypothetical protein